MSHSQRITVTFLLDDAMVTSDPPQPEGITLAADRRIKDLVAALGGTHTRIQGTPLEGRKA